MANEKMKRYWYKRTNADGSIKTCEKFVDRDLAVMAMVKDAISNSGQLHIIENAACTDDGFNYTIEEEECKCTVGQYMAVLGWVKRQDGYDGAIGGMVDEFLWYPSNKKDELAIVHDHWWGLHVDEWNSIPPSSDYCADEAKRTGCRLETIVLEVTEEMAEKCEKFNQETKDRIEKMRNQAEAHTWNVCLSTTVKNTICVEAESKAEAIEKARKVAAMTASSNELPAGWNFAHGLSAHQDTNELNIETVSLVK